jgi:hypothetical protein
MQATRKIVAVIIVSKIFLTEQSGFFFLDEAITTI